MDVVRHDLLTLPGGHLVHYSGCWCGGKPSKGTKKDKRLKRNKKKVRT